MRSLAVSAARLLNLEVPDVAALLISGLLGFMAWFYLPRGPWSSSISVLVSYHLFLGWLLISADEEPGTRFPLVSGALTHLACLAAVCGLAVTVHHIPYVWVLRLIPGFGFLRYGFAAFAIFERNWLVSGRTKVGVAADRAALVIAASPDDYQAWVQHLSQRSPFSVKPGTSVRAEYEQWMKARMRGRAARWTAFQGD